jgi:hypothetical protein
MTGWWDRLGTGMRLLASALAAQRPKPRKGWKWTPPNFGLGPMTEDEARYIKALMFEPDQFASERVRDHWAAVRKALESGVGWNESLKVAGDQFGLTKDTIKPDYMAIENILPPRLQWRHRK